jgi:hypothetical protein
MSIRLIGNYLFDWCRLILPFFGMFASFNGHPEPIYQQLNMYISNNKYRLAPITEDNLIETCTLLTEQFLA